MQKEKEQPQLTCESCSDRKCITEQSVSATSWLLDHKQANTSLSFWEWKPLPLPLRFRMSHFFVFSTCLTAIYLYLVGNHFWNKTLCFNNNSRHTVYSLIHICWIFSFLRVPTFTLNPHLHHHQIMPLFSGLFLRKTKQVWFSEF